MLEANNLFPCSTYKSHWSCISMQATFDKDGKLQVSTSVCPAAMALLANVMF